VQFLDSVNVCPVSLSRRTSWSHNWKLTPRTSG
jgi:hypothetical protein